MKITDDILKLSGMNEHQLRRELALWLYSKGKLSLGRASQFAGMHKIEFMDFMAANNVPMNYSVADLEQDMKTIENLGL